MEIIITKRIREPQAVEIYSGKCPYPIRSNIGCFEVRTYLCAVCAWSKTNNNKKVVSKFNCLRSSDLHH